MKKLLALSLICLASFSVDARAQSVRQSGNITPGHVAQWLTTGVIGDGGTIGGGATLNGSFVANDFVCVNANGTAPLLIDCGFSATGTNNWVGIQNFNGGATALTRSAGDSTLNVATTQFVLNQTGGVTISGTPVAGYVPVATSASAAIWEDFATLSHTWTMPQTFTGSVGIATSHALSGAATLGNLDTFTVSSDTQQCAFCTDIYSTWNYGGATARGARANIFAWNIQTSANSGSGTTAGIGATFIGQTNTGDGGTGLTNALVRGSYFGANTISRINGTNIQNAFSLEADVMSAAASSARYSAGVAAVNFESVQASTIDAAFLAYSGGSIAAAGGGGPYGPGVGFNCGLCFAELSATGFVPLNSTATVIGTRLETLSNIPVNTVLDMTGFAPSAFYIKSGPFNVDPSGQPTFGLGGTTGRVTETVSGGNTNAGDGALLRILNNGIGLGSFGNVSAQFGTAYSQTMGLFGFVGLNLYTNNIAAISIDGAQNAVFSGMIHSSAGLPTIASGACGTGTNGAVVAGSTNQAGNITIGAAATTTCTISWSATLVNAPNACVFFPANAAAAATGTTVARTGAPSTTQVVLTGSALANANYSYICL